MNQLFGLFWYIIVLWFFGILSFSLYSDTLNISFMVVLRAGVLEYDGGSGLCDLCSASTSRGVPHKRVIMLSVHPTI
jgi:hypothetical protein